MPKIRTKTSHIKDFDKKARKYMPLPVLSEKEALEVIRKELRSKKDEETQ